MTVRRLHTFIAIDGNLADHPGNMSYISLPKNAIKAFYHRQEDAEKQAQSYAAAHPGIPVLLLSAVAVFEAKKPETTQKEFKDNGELIPRTREG